MCEIKQILLLELLSAKNGLKKKTGFRSLICINILNKCL